MPKSYIATIIFNILKDGHNLDEYEEQTRLVFAKDKNDAIALATQLAHEEESSFEDVHRHLISWKFIEIKDVQPVSLTQGSLLHSVIKESKPVCFV